MKTTVMRNIFLSLSSVFMFACFGGKKVYTVDEATKNKIADMDRIKTIYDLKVETISGDTLDLASLKGKKVILVNTASKCGLTPQFEQLEQLYKEFKDQNFVIIGFPTNDFMGQDPGSNEEIAEFCQMNYGVTFPMMAKRSTRLNSSHVRISYAVFCLKKK